MHRAFSTAVGVLVVAGTLGVSAQQSASAGAKHRASAQTATGSTRASVGLLPGTKGNPFTTIQGNALDSTNGVLANHTVRLRDVRFGRIVDVTITDKSGMFTFRDVEPGSYVVELVGNDQTILAASQILNVDAGQSVSAVVKLPFKVPPFGGLLGHTVASAVAISSAAAAAGLLATAVTGTDASSNGKPNVR
jgi:hypothetical protein